MTGTTSACFEPSIDYVVTKIPRWNFDKFEGVDEELTTQMKAVGEVMAIGRTFEESLQKAWQSLEIGYAGLGGDREEPSRDYIRERLKRPRWDRLLQIRNAFRLGASVEEIADITKFDPWYLHKIAGIVAAERRIEKSTLDGMTADEWREYKRMGFSDVQIAYLLGGDVTENEVRAKRKSHRRDARLQRRRHVRRGVRGADAVLLLDLRNGAGECRQRQRKSHHPGQRAEPDRAGHRVRL